MSGNDCSNQTVVAGMNTIKELEWHPSLGDWFADLSRTERLHIFTAAPITLVLVTRRAPDQLLGEFRSLDEAFHAAAEWVGDS